MTLKQAIKKANSYSSKDQSFSELKYWKLIYQKTSKAFHQFRYADSLRLCGFYKESEKMYLSISVNDIPKEHRYLYYLYLGYLHKDQGNFAMALSSYLKSLKLKSDATIPYVFIAEILKLQEKDQQAIRYLKKALTKAGDIDEVNYNLATSYARVGQLQNALTAIINCLNIDSRYPNARKIKKDVEELLTRDKIDISF